MAQLQPLLQLPAAPLTIAQLALQAIELLGHGLQLVAMGPVALLQLELFGGGLPPLALPLLALLDLLL